MKKSDVVSLILTHKFKNIPILSFVKTFAPVNIALCKYWGKRDTELNLPITNSLSLSLKQGTHTELSLHEGQHDLIILNNQIIDSDSAFAKRASAFLDLFRKDIFFKLNITSEVPIAAGLASSASGFASLTLALNQLFGFELSNQQLSILARLGSGSACRSIEPGFVEWHKGERVDGLDSFAENLKISWPDLCVELLMINDSQKEISSREGMAHTVKTSILYKSWPSQVEKDLKDLKKALLKKDFTLLGETAEANALAMHATAIGARPPIHYSLPDTLFLMQKIWQLRQQGLEIYFTQDAGPNLKLLFLKNNWETVRLHFKDYLQ